MTEEQIELMREEAQYDRTTAMKLEEMLMEQETDIDALPAGPELDALACKAVGWEAKRQSQFFCGKCGSRAGKSGPACGDWVEKQVVVDRPISTDIATAMEALATETIQCYRITKVGTAGFSVVLGIHEATSKNLTLAIARALAKAGLEAR